jgi:hypothetical protein
MRIILGVMTIILAAASVGTAQYGQMMGGMPPPRTQSVPKETLTGYLVDKSCALRATSLTAVGPTHSTQCLLKAHEPALGVVANGRWIPFDEKGSKKAVELLTKSAPAKGTKVVVTGRMKESAFAVSKIEYLKL